MKLGWPAMSWSIAALVVVIWPSPLHATTYHVDSAAGDDARDGQSIKAAWQTIAKVNASAFKPGDSVLFKRGGLWRETLEVPSSGTPGKPITFGAYGEGDRPIICGADVIHGFKPMARNTWSVVLDQAAPPREEGDGSLFEGLGEANVWFDGRRGTRAKSKDALGPEANWYYDGYRLYVYSKTDPDKTFTSGGVELPVRLEGVRLDKRPYRQRDRKYVTIQDLHLTKIRRWAVDAINSDHAVIRRCEVDWIGPGNRQGGYLNDPVAIGLNWDTSNGLVEDCDLHDCNCGVYIGTAEPGFHATGNSVINCRIYNVRSGINAKVHATGGVFEGNEVYNVRSQGIRSVGDEKAGNRIVRNFVHHCAAEGIELRSNNVVAYNVIASCTNAPVIIIADTGESEDNIDGGDGNIICNNTFHNTPMNSGVSLFNPKGTDVRNNVVTNNIFFGVFLPVRFSGGIPADGAGNVIDYNCYWNPNPNNAYARQPGRMALADWQNKLGWDRHSVFADPKFAAAKPIKARDFALRAGSPCIDAGAKADFKVDFAGAKVPAGKAADIGAFEFGASPASQPATMPTTVTSGPDGK